MVKIYSILRDKKNKFGNQIQKLNRMPGLTHHPF